MNTGQCQMRELRQNEGSQQMELHHFCYSWIPLFYRRLCFQAVFSRSQIIWYIVIHMHVARILHTSIRSFHSQRHLVENEINRPQLIIPIQNSYIYSHIMHIEYECIPHQPFPDGWAWGWVRATPAGLRHYYLVIWYVYELKIDLHNRFLLITF